MTLCCWCFRVLGCCIGFDVGVGVLVWFLFEDVVLRILAWVLVFWISLVVVVGNLLLGLWWSFFEFALVD